MRRRKNGESDSTKELSWYVCLSIDIQTEGLKIGVKLKVFQQMQCILCNAICVAVMTSVIRGPGGWSGRVLEY